MRNPFRSKHKAKSPEAPSDPNSVREPWNRQPSPGAPSSPRKTIVGKKPDAPFLDKKTPPLHTTGHPCPACSYPLPSEVSAATPCPNCGFTGASEAPHVPSSTVAKPTLALGELHLGRADDQLTISLIDETDSDRSVTFELDSTRGITLGREQLAPDNHSIAREAHVRIYEQHGRWYVRNLSDSPATFVQALEPSPLSEGDEIILGRRRFRFSSESSMATDGDTKQTLPLSRLSRSPSSITLTDERGSPPYRLGPPPVVLNRSTIDANELSISRQQHARIEFHRGQWTIVDLSSNQATFVQVVRDRLLSPSARLLLGDKLFRFEVE